MNVLVTGANGFVGSHLVQKLIISSSFKPIAATRNPHNLLSKDVPNVFVGDLCAETDWSSALNSIDIVVHTAALVHVINDAGHDSIQEFREVNVEGTLNLARQAAAHDVKRFIYISSVKVNGEVNVDGRPFTEADVPNPQDSYGVSKMESEQGLGEISSKTGMEVVIIRPPLVYGPGVGANFLRMMNVICRGIPLPLASVHNKRSLLGIGNLVSAIIKCLDHPNAVGKTFLVSDDDDMSTPDLIKRLSESLGRSAKLIPFPQAILKMSGKLIGKGYEVDRLLGSLIVDSSAIQQDLDWTPAYSVQQELNATAEWYRMGCTQL